MSGTPDFAAMAFNPVVAAATNGSHGFLVNLCLAIAAGTFLVGLARRLKLPTIVLLLLGGVLLGPEGVGLIDSAAFGDALPALVSFAVGVILFEGGLTLDLHGFAQAPQVIRRLLTVGVLVTWLGTAAAIYGVFRFDLRYCLFVGSLVIVTGPTVILPLLRRINVQPRLHSILHWEGVLIDAIGVFIAILCFEWIVAGEGTTAVARFLLRVLAGLGIGIAGGFFIDLQIRWRVVPESIVNAFALASAVLIFGLTEWAMPEAGLLAVTVAGLVVGWRHPVELKQIKQFKAELTDLLVGTLFIVLAGRLELARFVDLGAPGAAVLTLMLIVVRPLSVFVSTQGSALSWQERAFLSWVAPRGIVAASMASLFALDLAHRETSFDGGFVETFVYAVIATTVVLQGFSAGIVARLLRLRRPDPTGWMIVGASRLGIEVGRFISRSTEDEVTILDSNARMIGEAAEAGLTALCADALDRATLESDERFQRVGHVVGLTDNVELNEIVCQRWRDPIGRDDLFRWGAAKSGEDEKSAPTVGVVIWDRQPRPGLLSAELARGEAVLRDLVKGAESLAAETIPLALVRKDEVILGPVFAEGEEPKEGDKLLVLHRTGGFLSRGIQFGGMVDAMATTLTGLHEQLVARACVVEPSIKPEILLGDLIEREKAMPTVLGHGVAVPHAIVAGITRRMVIMARVSPGVDSGNDGEPLTLFFLIISPTGDPEGHLATLADVARVCSDASNRDRLRSAGSLSDVLMVLRQALE